VLLIIRRNPVPNQDIRKLYILVNYTYNYTGDYMIEIETRLKPWGNSVGVVIPKDELISEGLNINDEVEITIKKKRNIIRETFGICKIKTPTDELLKESDKNGWDE